MTKMFWDPKTGHPTIYQDDETPPEGHLPTHPKNPALRLGADGQPGGGAATAAAEKPMTRTETVAALQAGGIEFDNKATAAALQELLRKALLDALHEREVEGVDGMTTRELLIAVEQ